MTSAPTHQLLLTPMVKFQTHHPTIQQRSTPKSNRLIQELCRQETEAENESSPLLRLPGELRNEVYKYLTPTNDVFSTDGNDRLRIKDIEKDTFHRTLSIKKGEAHGQLFKLTQVCHILRDESRKFFYGSNIFLVRIEGGHGGHPRFKTDPKAAKAWIKGLPSDALTSISRVILFGPCFIRPKFCTADIVLFDFAREDLKRLQVEDSSLRPCSCQIRSSDHCGCTLERKKRPDFRDALQVVMGCGEGGSSRNKLLKLVNVFRDEVGQAGSHEDR